MRGALENHESNWRPIEFMIPSLSINTRQESCQDEAMIKVLIYEVMDEL